MKKRKTNKMDPKKVAILCAVALIVVIVIVAIPLIGGNDGLGENPKKSFKADTSTVFVLNDGKVVSTDVEAFDETKYNAEELEKFLKETIDTYNEENGEDSAKQKDFSVKNNVATLILEYSNADVYEDFYGIELFAGTVSEASKAGYAFDVEFARITDGKAENCEVGEITDQSDLKVAIIKANTRVVVEGEIVYISADNVSEYGKDWVSLKDNCNIFDSLAEDTETENTEPATEDTVVGEDELVVGTEVSTEVIFDFGDEEKEDTTKVEYSEKYVYIIYK